MNDFREIEWPYSQTHKQKQKSYSYNYDSPPKNTLAFKEKKLEPMEEMMMVMMNIRSNENNNNNLNIPITTSTCPTWKLYENPFYSSHQQLKQQIHNSDHNNPTRIHTLHLPVPARKIAASFWDLTFIDKPLMEPAISELKAELDRQCKARKKAESLNKRLARELYEERKGREALERAVQELAREIDRMKNEMEEERKMLRTAEVIREERVHMKLAEARVVMEEKLSELEIARKIANDHSNCRGHEACFGQKLRFVLGENNILVDIGDSRSTAVVEADQLPPRSSVENPHIRRGIKGFVEFPRVVRAIGCKQNGVV